MPRDLPNEGITMTMEQSCNEAPVCPRNVGGAHQFEFWALVQDAGGPRTVMRCRNCGLQATLVGAHHPMAKSPPYGLRQWWQWREMVQQKIGNCNASSQGHFMKLESRSVDAAGRVVDRWACRDCGKQLEHIAE